MSKQDEKYMALASHYATLSDMRSRHGSVIVLHGSIIAWGFNHERNYSRDKLIGHPMSCHAEMSALRDAIRKLKLNPQKDRATFKRMHLYVARRSSQNGYMDSKPCEHCYHKLKDIGLTRIMYSGQDESFYTMDVRSPQACTPSSGYQYQLRIQTINKI
jgi:deoxycytidylate deaminase